MKRIFVPQKNFYQHPKCSASSETTSVPVWRRSNENKLPAQIQTQPCTGYSEWMVEQWGEHGGKRRHSNRDIGRPVWRGGDVVQCGASTCWASMRTGDRIPSSHLQKLPLQWLYPSIVGSGAGRSDPRYLQTSQVTGNSDLLIQCQTVSQGIEEGFGRCSLPADTWTRTCTYYTLIYRQHTRHREREKKKSVDKPNYNIVIFL